MKKLSTTQRILSATAICGAILATSAPALAGPKLFAYFGDAGITFNGTTEVDGGSTGNVDPFVVELFSTGNECLKIQVTQQGADLEATLVSPDGRTWRDDDSGGLNRPLIKAITTKRGWHILRLSHYNGAGVHADFTVNVSRKNASVHCQFPTPPANLFAVSDTKPAAPSGAFVTPSGGTNK